MKNLILGFTALVAAFVGSFTATVAPAETAIYEIRPTYDIVEKFNVNSTDTRTHRNAASLELADIYYLNYAYSRNYYPENTPLEVTLAKNISVSPADFCDLRIEYRSYTRTEDTPIEADNIKIYVSYDCGQTYDAEAIPVTVTPDKDATFRHSGGTTAAVLYKVETVNLEKYLGGRTITNVKIVPSANISKAAGAFRLVSFAVYGVKRDAEAQTVPAFPQLSNTTSDPVTFADGKYGYTLYKTDFSFFDGWSSNSTVYKISEATINGKQVNYASFVVGKSRIIEATFEGKYNPASITYTVENLQCKPLKVISPELDINAASYDSIPVEFRFWRNTNNEPEADFKVYYSSSCGERWQTRDVEFKVEETGEVIAPGGKTEYKVYRATFDLKKLALGTKVTNLYLMPYPELKNGTNEYFRIIDFKITGYSTLALGTPITTTYDINYDSMVIQKMIDDAKASGKNEVTIPHTNPRTGTNEWLIATEIVLPSDMTLYIDNCTLTRYVYSYCNIITAEKSYTKGVSIDMETKNIKVIGIGNATLKADKDNGHNKFSRVGRYSSLPITYTNNLLYFRNVNGFEVRNLTMYEPTFWSMNYVFCRNGIIDNIYFYCTNKIINQDGIDLRIGNNNITISNLYGSTGDDTVALTALSGSSEKNLAVTGKDVDIHDIKIHNVYSRVVGHCFNVRLLCHDGAKIYNVDIDNIIDTGIDFSTNSKVRAAVILGHPEYYSKTPMQKGDIDKITISNVKSGASVGAVWQNHANVLPENYTVSNISSVKGGVPMIATKVKA